MFADFSLGTCVTNYLGVPLDTPDGIAVTATDAYIVDINGGNLTTCTVNPDGSLFPCSQQSLDGTNPAGGNTPNASPRSAFVYGGISTSVLKPES